MTPPTELSVKQANKNLYDLVGGRYEELDGRRNPELNAYASEQLARAASLSTCGVDRILDLGSGTGFVSRAAAGHFKRCIAIDLSLELLKAFDGAATRRVAGDTDTLPFADASFSCVASFAVLHHLYAYSKLTSELARVLAPGGVFYSDHDMDERFYARFEPALKIYRALKGSRDAYVSSSDGLDDEDYELAECHEDGIPTASIAEGLRSVGFSEVRVEYHWYGLSPLTNSIFGKRSFASGRAPLVRIIATR